MRNTILKKRWFPTSNKTSLLRSLVFSASAAAAAAGSGLYFYSNIDTESTRPSLWISVSIPRHDHASWWPWRTWGPMFNSPGAGPLQHGNVPLFFSRSGGDIPPADTSKEANGEGSRSCNGCLSRDSIANAAAITGPAVVNLSVSQVLHGVTLGKSIGSGTLIDSDGTILTCAHLVASHRGLSTKAGKVDVTLQDGRTFEGKLINADLHSDIAIVKINSKTPLPSAKLGSSSNLRPGDWVLAMGCPHSLQNTVTAGIVSCVDRKSSDLGIGGMRREYLQTDCAINSGNSGGPLVSIDGEVVGVNIMKIRTADGLGFSVPIDSVVTIMQHFKNRGMVVRPWLGLKMIDLNDMIIAQLRERDASFPNVTNGVLVPMVTPGSPADRAGFLPGDVVVQFNGKPVGSIKEIIELIGDQVGIPLKAVVMRRAGENSTTLTIIPEEANPNV